LYEGAAVAVLEHVTTDDIVELEDADPFGL
jgi:hypothetical protein